MSETVMDATEADAGAGAGPADDPLLALHSLPGHLIRRCRQKSSFMFMECCADFDVTPIQYAVLKVVGSNPAIDQSELAARAALDASTTGQVVARLARRGLLFSRRQGQRRLATLTPAGRDLVARIGPAVTEAQVRTLQPLTQREQRQLLRLLSKMLGLTTPYHSAARPRHRQPW